LLPLLLGACIPDLAVVECVLDPDCAGGMVCVDRACVFRPDVGPKDASSDASLDGSTDANVDAGEPDALERDAEEADAGESDADEMDAEPEDALPPDNGMVSFAYPPSNFVPRAPGPTGRLWAQIGDTCSFDTTTLVFTNCSAAPNPDAVDVDISNPTPTVIVHVAAMRLDTPLAITGERAIIFAVYGNAVIDSIIEIDAPHAGGGLECMNLEGSQGTLRGGGGGAGFGQAGRGGGYSGGGGGGSIGTELSPLRGGCSGGVGSGSAAGGFGGGALQISAAGNLVVRSLVTVPGGGGAGGTAMEGGGGGGSGGGILLEGDSIVIATATIAANGGGGGGGGGPDFGTGSAGSPGQKTDSGGSGGPGAQANGNDGGRGGGRASLPTIGGTPVMPAGVDAGGGGGGGGAGVIVFFAATGCAIDPSSIISPAYTRRTGASNACP
jgi:hypothetical protein